MGIFVEVLGLVIRDLRDVDEHIAAVLQEVALLLARLSLSGTIDRLHDVVVIIIGRTEIDEGVVQAGLEEQGIIFAVTVSIGSK